MRSFQGIASNISQPVIGKIVSEASSLEGSGIDSLVFVFEDSLGGELHSGMIFQETVVMRSGGSYPQIRLLEAGFPMAVGDIVLLEQSGAGTVLFEKRSRSNAVVLTERCNCRCVTCPQPPRNERDDLVDLSLRIVSLMDVDTEVLGITGGEPTLAWQGLMEVLVECGRRLPNTGLQLLTNGRVLKDFPRARELAETARNDLLLCIPLYADVDRLHDEIVGSKGAFWDTLEGLFSLARVGVPVELRTVIIRPNYERLAEWAEFVYRTVPFVSHVALMGLEPIGLAEQNLSSLWIDPVDYAVHLRKAVRVLHRRNLNVSIYNHQLCTLPEDLWPFARRSISEWKTIYMSECDGCAKRAECGGFFHSASNRRSRGIKAFGNSTNGTELVAMNGTRKES